MKINEFIAKVGKIENTTVIKNTLIVKDYLPFSEKKALAKRIIAKSIVEENGFVRIDEIDKYLIFTIEVIQAYTNLEFDEDINVASKEYDLLANGNKLSMIIDMFESEYKIILDLTCMEASYVTQQNGIEYQAASLFNGINQSLTKLTNVLLNKVEEFNINDLGVSEDDMAQFLNFMGQYVK